MLKKYEASEAEAVWAWLRLCIQREAGQHHVHTPAWKGGHEERTLFPSQSKPCLQSLHLCPLVVFLSSSMLVFNFAARKKSTARLLAARRPQSARPGAQGRTPRGAKEHERRKPRNSKVTGIESIECCSMLLHVAPCCSMLLHVAPCCSMLLHVAPCCSMLLHVAPCCSMLLHVAPCCSMLLPCTWKESCQTGDSSENLPQATAICRRSGPRCHTCRKATQGIGWPQREWSVATTLRGKPCVKNAVSCLANTTK